jgi:hypothetical protein
MSVQTSSLEKRLENIVTKMRNKNWFIVIIMRVIHSLLPLLTDIGNGRETGDYKNNKN